MCLAHLCNLIFQIALSFVKRIFNMLSDCAIFVAACCVCFVFFGSGCLVFGVIWGSGSLGLFGSLGLLCRLSIVSAKPKHETKNKTKTS